MSGLLDCWMSGLLDMWISLRHPTIQSSNNSAGNFRRWNRIARFDFMTNFLADATNEQIGIFVFAGAVVTGFIATLVSVASNFATRREVEELKTRVDKIETDLDD